MSEQSRGIVTETATEAVLPVKTAADNGWTLMVDEEAGTAYLGRNGVVERTITGVVVNLDYDALGRLIGVELLS